MKASLIFTTGLVCGGVAVMLIPRAAAFLHANAHSISGGHDSTATTKRAHTEEKFEFTVDGPMAEVAPLFGAEKERLWAPEWNPQFLHPVPASDERGMVFTTVHGQHHASWVNTEFDLQNGRIQYAYLIPGGMVTLVTLRLSPEGQKTHVEVEYDRTALSEDADSHVRHLADQDRTAGAEWEKQINAYFSSRAPVVK
jgi:hypothetical protein